MTDVKFEHSTKVVKVYGEFLKALPGLVYIKHTNNEITLYLKPDKVDLARLFVASNLDGIPVKVKPRSNPPAF